MRSKWLSSVCQYFLEGKLKNIRKKISNLSLHNVVEFSFIQKPNSVNAISCIKDPSPNTLIIIFEVFFICNVLHIRETLKIEWMRKMQWIILEAYEMECTVYMYGSCRVDIYMSVDTIRTCYMRSWTKIKINKNSPVFRMIEI